MLRVYAWSVSEFPLDDAPGLAAASPAVGCGRALHLIGGGGFLAGFVLAGSAAGGAAW